MQSGPARSIRSGGSRRSGTDERALEWHLADLIRELDQLSIMGLADFTTLGEGSKGLTNRP